MWEDIGLPRRRKAPAKTLIFLQKKAQAAQRTAPVQEVHVCPLTVLEASELAKKKHLACQLNESFRWMGRGGGLLKVRCQSKPELYFYVRTHNDSFGSSVKGVGLLRQVYELAKFTDHQVDVMEVSTEDEAMLAEVVLVIGDRYMSKRDLWHLHLTAIQGDGQLLWSHFDNFWQQCPGSLVDKLVAKSGRAAVSGVAKKDTNVLFKSACGNIVLLLEISAELFDFDVSGSPYWQVLMQNFEQIVEQSLRLKNSSSLGKAGHYIRMMMFCRTRQPLKRMGPLPRLTAQENVLGEVLASNGELLHTALAADGDKTVKEIKQVIASITGAEQNKLEVTHDQRLLQDCDRPFAGASSSEATKLVCRLRGEDFYDVFWEGFAKAMPPVSQLLARIRKVCACLFGRLGPSCWQLKNQAGANLPMPIDRRRPPEDWNSVDPATIVQSSEGNLLESLNLVIDHFDQHHLDRLFKVTGQQIVVLTAGSGLLRASSKDLYELTERRVNASISVYPKLISIKEPPLHPVPLVQFPSGDVQNNEWHSPSWLVVSYIPPMTFWVCEPKPNAKSRSVHSAFLHLEKRAPDATRKRFIPFVNDFDLGTLSEDEEEESMKKRAKCATSFADGAKVPAWAHVGARQPEVFKFSEMQFMRLRSHFNRNTETTTVCLQGEPDWKTTYTVAPNREFAHGLKSERSSLAHDLIGLRLSVLTATEMREEDKNSFKEEMWKQKKKVTVAGDKLKQGCEETLTFDRPNDGLLEVRQVTDSSDVTAELVVTITYPLEPRPSGLWEFGPDVEAKCVCEVTDTKWRHELKLAPMTPTVITIKQYPKGQSLGFTMFHKARPRSCPDMKLYCDPEDPRSPMRAPLSSEVPQIDGDLDGGLIPEAFRQMRLTAADGEEWVFKDTDEAVQIEASQNRVDDRAIEKTYTYDSYYVRRCTVKKDGGCHWGANSKFQLCKKVFHQQNIRMHEWNLLDEIIAGNLEMPAALPYPVQCESEKSSSRRRCDGWKLRSAVKQHLYVLVPLDETERAQQQYLHHVLDKKGGKIRIGKEIFDEFKNLESCPEELEPVRDRCLARFKTFLQGLEDVCFGGSDTMSRDRERLRNINTEGKSFQVRRQNSTVYVKGMKIASAFPGSRDWFEMFYNNAYSPPKFFHLVLQWIVCSSVHKVHFLTKLHELATKNGFALLQLPITQLFPQPAPPWVWNSGDQETNFDRPPFYTRHQISLKSVQSSERDYLYAELLRCWLNPPHDFFFIFASPNLDYLATRTPQLGYKRREEQLERQKSEEDRKQFQLFQRLKGWVLCEKRGLCLVALREDHIYFYENWLVYSNSVGIEQVDDKLDYMATVWQEFYDSTQQILARYGAEDEFHCSWICSPTIGPSSPPRQPTSPSRLVLEEEPVSP